MRRREFITLRGRHGRTSPAAARTMLPYEPLILDDQRGAILGREATTTN